MLAAIAVKECLNEKGISKEDVENTKEKIKEIYDSIPSKEKTEIILKALDEAKAEIIRKEIESIKNVIADLNKEELSELHKELRANLIAQCIPGVGALQPKICAYYSIQILNQCRIRVVCTHAIYE